MQVGMGEPFIILRDIKKEGIPENMDNIKIDRSEEGISHMNKIEEGCTHRDILCNSMVTPVTTMTSKSILIIMIV